MPELPANNASVVFPSPAQMACEKQWIALLNICRQRPRLDLDGSVVHNGYNAVEWAVSHGELGVAQELLYWQQVKIHDELNTHRQQIQMLFAQKVKVLIGQYCEWLEGFTT
jgi:hypothetical protein